MRCFCPTCSHPSLLFELGRSWWHIRTFFLSQLRAEGPTPKGGISTPPSERDLSFAIDPGACSPETSVEAYPGASKSSDLAEALGGPSFPAGPPLGSAPSHDLSETRVNLLRFVEPPVVRPGCCNWHRLRRRQGAETCRSCSRSFYCLVSLVPWEG